MIINVCRLTPTAKLPTRKHPTDAGLDLYSDSSDFVLRPGDVTIVGTGVKVMVPWDHFGLITNKSRSDYLVGGGIVDAPYRGELLVKLINPSNAPINIDKGMSIAQLLIIPCALPLVHEILAEEFLQTPTDRDTSGGIAKQYVRWEPDGMEVYIGPGIKLD